MKRVKVCQILSSIQDRINLGLVLTQDGMKEQRERNSKSLEVCLGFDKQISLPRNQADLGRAIARFLYEATADCSCGGSHLILELLPNQLLW